MRDERTAEGRVVVFRDITATKRTDEALMDGEDRFRAIMDNSPALIFIKGSRGAGTCRSTANSKCSPICHNRI